MEDLCIVIVVELAPFAVLNKLDVGVCVPRFSVLALVSISKYGSGGRERRVWVVSHPLLLATVSSEGGLGRSSAN